MGVTVTAPNGGESLSTTTAYLVQWTKTGTVSSFDVQFSSNGGSSFSPITGCTGLSGTTLSCSWGAPGPATTTGRVRVIARDSGGNQVSDDSNANFTITAGGGGSVTVSNPNNGALIWGIGTTRRLQWTHTLGTGTSVKIELSRNAGTTWELIQASVLNATATTGTYDWVVTGPATAQALIKISAVVGGASDVSDANFTIAAPSLTVTSPNLSTVVWLVGSQPTITWTGNVGTLDNVKIELSKDGGLTYPVVILASTPSDGNQKVTVLSSWVTATAKVRITWLANPSVVDVSDAVFVVQ
jgi:hypothetical protein